MKVKELINRLEDFLPNQEVNVEIEDKNNGVWYISDKNKVSVTTHTHPKKPFDLYIYGCIGKQGKNRWFCKKHGIEGKIADDWCFGCYKLDEDTEKPVPYIGWRKK